MKKKYIKYIILLKFSISIKKQKEFLNELNSLVAIYFIISLCYKNNELVRFFPFEAWQAFNCKVFLKTVTATLTLTLSCWNANLFEV